MAGFAPSQRANLTNLDVNNAPQTGPLTPAVDNLGAQVDPLKINRFGGPVMNRPWGNVGLGGNSGLGSWRNWQPGAAQQAQAYAPSVFNYTPPPPPTAAVIPVSDQINGGYNYNADAGAPAQS